MLADPSISSAIRDAIAQNLGDRDSPKGLWHREYHGADGTALPLTLLAWVEVWAVTVDGAFIGIEVEEGTWEERALTLAETAIAIREAQSRYPFLAGLLPVRPAEAVCCAACGGSGLLDRLEVYCECGELGWVLPPG